MRALRFQKFGPPSVLEWSDVSLPAASSDEALVEVRATAINPSDVKNVEGRFAQTRLPRTPGRDYAGVVSAGPREWIGAAVWGTGGDLGFTRDGSHAEAVLVPVRALRRKPERLRFAEAAAVGTPFLTAELGLSRAALARGETVLVIGAAGGVGGAAVLLAAWRGARVIGLVRDEAQAELVRGLGAEALVVARGGSAGEALKGVAADVAFDTSGFELEAAVGALGRGGRVIAISAPPDGRVTLSLRDLYRKSAQLIGVDSLALATVEAADVLDRLAPGFESGALRPPRFVERPLADAIDAYQQRGKQVLIR